MENTDIFYQYLEFPLGYVLVKADNKKVLEIRFLKEKQLDRQNDITRLCVQQLKEYFSGKRRDFTCPFWLKGTDFRLKVWQATMQIPWGKVITYKNLAMSIGNPRSYRAVANALGANPLPIIVPCHRVIASDGTIGGYSPGVEIKKWLLTLEEVTL